MQPRARDSRFALANLPCVYRTQSSSQAPAVHASGEVELMLQAYRYSASTHNLDRALYGRKPERPKVPKEAVSLSLFVATMAGFKLGHAVVAGGGSATATGRWRRGA